MPLILRLATSVGASPNGECTVELSVKCRGSHRCPVSRVRSRKSFGAGSGTSMLVQLLF